LATWFFIALGCAFFTACCDAVSKYLMRENDEWVTGSVLLALANLALLPLLLTIGLNPITIELGVVLAVALPLEILGYYLFLSAIRMAPLSLTVPLLAFTPVLTILTSAVLVGEHVTPRGALGISMVALGAYVLNGEMIRERPWAPITAVLANPGSRRMLLVAVIWSVTSTLGKKGILIYGAIPFGYLLTCGDLVVFIIICLARRRRGLMRINLDRRMWPFFLLAGMLMALAEVTHFVSLSMAPVSYMISVKRLSLVFGVILGWAFFDERNIRYRISGVLVMVAGVFFLS
jgi:drug/metabolite transporter (DMT)-like permease